MKVINNSSNEVDNANKQQQEKDIKEANERKKVGDKVIKTTVNEANDEANERKKVEGKVNKADVNEANNEAKEKKKVEGKVNKATVNEANNEANERKKVEDKVNKSTVKEANHEIHQIPKKINNSIKNAKISASNAAHEADLNKATAPPLKVINPSIPLKRAVQKEALLFNPLTMNNKYNKKGSFEYIYDKQNNPKILGAKIQAKLSGSNDPALIDPIHVNPMVVYDKNFEPLGKIVTKGMEHWTHFANPVAADSFLTNKGPKYPHQVNTIGKIVQGCHEEINQCIMHCRMTFSYNKVKGGP